MFTLNFSGTNALVQILPVLGTIDFVFVILLGTSNVVQLLAGLGSTGLVHLKPVLGTLVHQNLTRIIRRISHPLSSWEQLV